MKRLFYYFFALAFVLLTSCTYLFQKVPYNPIAAQYNVQLGLAYLTNDPIKAKQKLLLALQQAPETPVVLDAMAYYYEKAGDRHWAAFYYRRALFFDKHSGLAQNNYGAFLCKIGDYQAGSDYLLQAANNPNYLNTAKAYENAALCIEPYNRQKAEKYFLAAYKQIPSNTSTHLELSKFYWNSQRYLLAKKFIDLYLTYLPEDKQARQFRNKILHKISGAT